MLIIKVRLDFLNGIEFCFKLDKKPGSDVQLKREWIDSVRSGWYEGLTRDEHTPSTDNALASIYGIIKSIHTLRERLAVNSYHKNACDMFKNWSMDGVVERKFSTNSNIKSDTWKMAHEFLQSADSTIKKFGKNLNMYILSKKENVHFINSDFINKNYCKIKNLDFDLLFKFAKEINIIAFDSSS
ncbi:unnamed protein product [Brachionus calyciflorus]|uniref:Uncharacterized protein n=1 Tax=Brachionus calyciflorus TaxID=104777 RepID=A0A814HVU9_9BILA|nr:unnamed protein product [Brachionus calyciflorus]